MNRTFGKIYKNIQSIYGLKPNDILLVSFPKSGNTWVRFFLCNLISYSEWGGETVDFTKLDSTMPEFGVDNLFEPWPYQIIPRFVKTHKPYFPFFRGKKSIYILRDPRDVMVSFFCFELTKKKPRISNDFSSFIRHKKLGLEPWFKHYKSWEKHSTSILFYEKLKVNDLLEFKCMLDNLDVNVTDKILNLAVENSRFENIRKIEQEFGRPKNKVFDEKTRFTRKGDAGGWKNYFSTDDLLYFEQLKEKYDVQFYE